MSTMDALADEIDHLSRRLIRNAECCDRWLAAQSMLTASQGYTLQTLEERGEITMNGLAEEMRLHGTTMTRMVDALVDKGLVERLNDPADRRVVRVRLSQRGRAAATELGARRRDFLASSFRDVPDEDLQAMMDGLRRLLPFVEKWGAECIAK